MRFKLKIGKQQEMISKAKEQNTWHELGEKLKLHRDYIRNELYNEKRTLHSETFYRLCEIIKEDYSAYISDKFEDNWGKSKGGKISRGNTKFIKETEKSELLAELLGIILGDGHIERRIKGKARNYNVKIAGHIKNDREYLSNHVSKIIEILYNERPVVRDDPNYGVMWIILHGREVVQDLISKGLGSGKKKRNNQGIPNWIKDNEVYLKACLRGLIDTDGSVHRISKENKNLRICFTSYIPNLLKDTRESFIQLGYSPSKIIREKQFFITRKDNVERYKKDIQFKNEKHLKRAVNLGQ